jgi:hypothetical protein
MKPQASRAFTAGPRTQRGFLLIVSVVLIVIAALLLTVMVFLGVTGDESSVGHSQSGQAMFLAESGVEAEQRRLAQDLKWYRAASDPMPNPALPQSMGAGTFTSQRFFPATALRARAFSGSVNPIRVYTMDRYPTAGCLRIEDEYIAYTGVSTSNAVCLGAGPCFTGITRASVPCGGGATTDHARGTAVYPVSALQTALAANCNVVAQIQITQHIKFLKRGTIKIGDEEIGYRDSSVVGANRVLSGITRCLDTTTGPPGNTPESHAINDRVTPVMEGDDSVDYEAEVVVTGTVAGAQRSLRKTVQR